MGIKLTLFRVNRGGFQSKPIAAEILYTNFPAYILRCRHAEKLKIFFDPTDLPERRILENLSQNSGTKKNSAISLMVLLRAKGPSKGKLGKCGLREGVGEIESE